MVRRLLLPLAAVVLIAVDDPAHPPARQVSDAELARAETATRDLLRGEHPTVNDAWARATAGTVDHANVSKPCTRGGC